MCLDLLRGLDMMLLLVVGPLVFAVNGVWHLPASVMAQFKHGWECFTLWDIIMPLFIFMCGAAIPLALPRRLTEGRAKGPYWRHVFSRFALLWICGMLVQGDLLSLDPLQIGPFSNTLQAIAVGYAVTAAVFLLPRSWMRVAVTAFLFVLYGLLVHFGGDYTPSGNVTAIVERKVFAMILPEGSVWRNVGFYTWIIPSLMFVAMTLCGLHATEILRASLSMRHRMAALAAYGVALLSAGLVVSRWVPVIKPIFTVSFTLQAMGWCVLALTALFAVTDVIGFRSHLGLPILFGRHCLFAYLALHPPFKAAFKALADAATVGLAHHFGKDVQALAAAVLVCCELVVALAIWDVLKRRSSNSSTEFAGVR